MTDELKSKIRSVAEFDGWVYNEAENRFEKDGTKQCTFPLFLLQDLNELHRVAVDVRLKLKQSRKAHWQFYNSNIIEAAIFESPTNGQYIDLLNAVYDGVVLLNQLNTEKCEE